MRVPRRIVELRSLIEAYPATRPAYPPRCSPKARFWRLGPHVPRTSRRRVVEPHRPAVRRWQHRPGPRTGRWNAG